MGGSGPAFQEEKSIMAEGWGGVGLGTVGICQKEGGPRDTLGEG